VEGAARHRQALGLLGENAHQAGWPWPKLTAEYGDIMSR
jgi:hypothetical protein